MPFRRETWHSDTARWVYILIVIASAVAMAVLFVMIRDDRHTITREASIRATQIQQQRYDASFSACSDQNQRHTRSIQKLHAIANEFLKTHPAMKAEVQASIANNILLIDAIVPKRNCKAVARLAVHPLANPSGR